MFLCPRDSWLLLASFVFWPLGLAGVLRLDSKDGFKESDQMMLVHVPRLVNSNNNNKVGASEGRCAGSLAPRSVGPDRAGCFSSPQSATGAEIRADNRGGGSAGVWILARCLVSLFSPSVP